MTRRPISAMITVRILNFTPLFSLGKKRKPPAPPPDLDGDDPTDD